MVRNYKPIKIKKMRNVNEKTIVKAIVDIKCSGYFKTPGLSRKERSYILDELERHGWIDEHCNPTAGSQDVVRNNLHLSSH
jgi:hypothetical protein